MSPFSPEHGLLGQAYNVIGVVAAFSIGLPGFSTYLYALRLDSREEHEDPVLHQLHRELINIVLAIVLVRLWGVVGLALAFGLAYDIAAVIAVVSLNRHSPGFDWRGLVSTWLRLIVAAAVMGGFVYGVVVLISPASATALIPAVGAGVAVGVVVYFACIYVLAVPGITELLSRLPGLRRFA
ncbi:MAG: polysaccharide biosynthesis C-terminal domain-containing protein [Acidimicrobiales bacterium]